MLGSPRTLARFRDADGTARGPRLMANSSQPVPARPKCARLAWLAADDARSPSLAATCFPVRSASGQVASADRAELGQSVPQPGKEISLVGSGVAHPSGGGLAVISYCLPALAGVGPHDPARKPPLRWLCRAEHHPPAVNRARVDRAAEPHARQRDRGRWKMSTTSRAGRPPDCAGCSRTAGEGSGAGSCLSACPDDVCSPAAAGANRSLVACARRTLRTTRRRLPSAVRVSFGWRCSRSTGCSGAGEIGAYVCRLRVQAAAECASVKAKVGRETATRTTTVE